MNKKLNAELKENLIEHLKNLIKEIENNIEIEVDENDFKFETYFEVDEMDFRGMIKKYTNGIKHVDVKLHLVMFDEKRKMDVKTLFEGNV